METTVAPQPGCYTRVAIFNSVAPLFLEKNLSIYRNLVVWSQNRPRIALRAPNFAKFSGGACPQIPLAGHVPTERARTLRLRDSLPPPPPPTFYYLPTPLHISVVFYKHCEGCSARCSHSASEGRLDTLCAASVAFVTLVSLYC